MPDKKKEDIEYERQKSELTFTPEIIKNRKSSSVVKRYISTGGITVR